ncbi:MAG: branched-chain amino acid ABC transporter permease [Pseudomonadota bacterium]
MSQGLRSTVLHLMPICVLLVLCFVLPAYHRDNFARILVLATYAMGYNMLFGYTGLLSLGHALFFGAGMYGMGLAVLHGGLPAAPAFLAGVATAAVVSLVIAALALRTVGVAFMIVTLMFAQAGYLLVLYFGSWTRGDEGFVIARDMRNIGGFDLTDPVTRYLAALALFSVVLLTIARMVHGAFGHVLVGIRENEARARMLGYDVRAHKLAAAVVSGTIAGAAGAAYGLLFGYVGATFISVQYSIYPLLWVILGGAGTTLGPLIGTFFMFYLIDWSSGLTSAYMLVAGMVLVLLVLFARTGILGEIRKRWVPWLP